MDVLLSRSLACRAGVFLLAAAFLLLMSAFTPAAASTFPPPIVPDGFGVNIHFTGAPKQDLDGLAKLGVRWIRMDFFWAGIEKTRGVYDFTAYDTLTSALAARHIRPIYILDYENSLYEQGSPSTPEARAAFARFAAAAATHFAHAGVVWEIWNEPNIGFWKPTPNVNDYAAMAVETAKAIKEADPHSLVIAPATSTMDFGFMEACFRAGLLKYIDAVSFHPYRPSAPETAAADYAQVRALIARYAPAGREIDLVSSEWGYTTADVSEEQQAQYLTREWLSNLEQEIKISIWYDWHDDGTDPKNGEHNFGTVNNDYSPKPAFVAGQTLTHTLAGYRFIKRVVTASDADYLLIFAKGRSYKLAAWTTGDPRTIPIPFAGTAGITSMLGERSKLPEQSGTLSLPISQSPVYVDVPPGNKDIALAASWTVTPAHAAYFGKDPKVTIRFVNPLDRPFKGSFSWVLPSGDSALVEVGKPFGPIRPGGSFQATYRIPGARIPLKADIGLSNAGHLDERCDLVPADPLTLSMAPIRPEGYGYLISNPAGEPFAGEMEESWPGHSVEAWISVKPGQRTKMTIVPGGVTSPAEMVKVLLESEDSKVSLSLPTQAFLPAAGGPDGWKAVLDGDPKVESKISLSTVPPMAPLNSSAAKLDYTFAQGWSFCRVFDPDSRPLAGKPTGETIWVNGDGSGNTLRMRFVDSTGQYFQTTAGLCDWHGWQPVSFDFSKTDARWGGANDGVIHYPICIDTILLLDSASRAQGAGSILICDPEIVYTSQPASRS